MNNTTLNREDVANLLSEHGENIAEFLADTVAGAGMLGTTHDLEIWETADVMQWLGY